MQPSGGIERVIVTLANKLCCEYEITILTKDPAISFFLLDKRVVFHSLENPLNFNMNNNISRVFTALKSVLINKKLLKSYLDAKTFDYYYLAHPLNVLEFHLARGVNEIDTIVTEHGAPDAYNLIYQVIKKWLYSKVKVYVVPTTADTVHYKSMGFRAYYIPHFKSDLAYEKVSLINNIALSVGRFTDVKQQIILLEIWNSLVNLRQIKGWKLFLVGSGELKEYFETYVNRNNLEDYVFLLPPSQDVAGYYKQSSLFLLSSKTEGFGMVLLEAISFGLPCISFDCPSGPRDIVKNNENGFLVPLNNKFALEQAVIKLISDSNLRKSMSQKAIDISSNWNHTKLLAQWKSILS